MRYANNQSPHLCHLRSQETPEQRRLRLLRDKEAHAQAKQTRLNQTTRFAVVDERDIKEHYCGPMDQRCSHCNALHFAGEETADGFNSCCHHGQVRLDRREYPRFLQALLYDPTHRHHTNFSEISRSYNAALSFASMGAQVVEHAGTGPYCFTTHGQVYHCATHVHPPAGEQPKYAQLYVLDSAEANEHRMRLPPNKECLPEVMQKIDAFLRVNNIYARTYRMMHDIERDQVDRALRENRQLPNISMILRRDRRSKRFDLHRPTPTRLP